LAKTGGCEEMIDYDHAKNSHGTEGPRSAFEKLLLEGAPNSLLDVGCGTGTWLRAALDSGITDVLGVDGVDIQPGNLVIPAGYFRQDDLTRPVDLGRKFSTVLCLEVAEHLDERHSGTLLDTLTLHSDRIIFSAACPGQPGQHHVNCQWPSWWQNGFNNRGFRCDDDLRWRLWEDSAVEPWYRQNIFVACRDSESAGREPRLRHVIHPEMLSHMIAAIDNNVKVLSILSSGSGPLPMQVMAFSNRIAVKARQKISRVFGRR
jgi:SAM-dependent methyltransferase